MTLLDRPVITDLASTITSNSASTLDGTEGLGGPASPSAIETIETVDDLEDDVPTGTSYARCADGNGTLTHLFFSDDEFDIARAKAICGKCGLAQQCLGDALDRAEPYGVWGGELLVDGVVVKVKRGRGRPPKHPRPPLVVDEVPLPPHLVA